MSILKLHTLPAVSLTSGVATPLTVSSLASAAITIQADSANTGVIYFGGAGVTTETGLAVSAGDTATIEPPGIRGHHEELDAASIYLISATTGVKMRVSIMRRD